MFIIYLHPISCSFYFLCCLFLYQFPDTDCCTRQCCGPLRPFDIQVTDNYQREVIRLVRPLRCQGCCFPCCLQELEIQSPPGQVIGYVRERYKCACFFPRVLPPSYHQVIFHRRIVLFQITDLRFVGLANFRGIRDSSLDNRHICNISVNQVWNPGFNQS